MSEIGRYPVGMKALQVVLLSRLDMCEKLNTYKNKDLMSEPVSLRTCDTSEGACCTDCKI